MALYNLERPVKFSQVKGQDKVVKILSHDMKEGIIHNAYLFCGTRGTGKTTVARILAQAVNCGHLEDDGSPCGKCDSCTSIRSNTSVDVFELDAASNNGVDDIRAILEKVQYKPIHKKKVFILDEVHMLSTSASNALLKVLEEPPEDVVFILCTTEKHKILPTIISRCACYEFEKISQKTICEHLSDVCKKHGVSYDLKALNVIAKAADGAMRDALSILDKFISEKEIRLEQVVDTLGMATDEVVFKILNALADKDAVTAVELLKQHTSKGGSLSFLIEEIFEMLLDMIEFQSTGDQNEIIGGEDYVTGIVNLAYKIDKTRAFQIMEHLRRVYQQKSGNISFAMITAFIAVIHEDSDLEILKEEVSGLKEKISSLEKEVSVLKNEGIRVSAAPSVDAADKSSAVVSEDETGSSGSIPSDSSEHIPDDIPSGAFESEDDVSAYDQNYLYEHCMKEFDTLPDTSDTAASGNAVTDNSVQSEAAPAENASQHDVTQESTSPLDSSMQPVPANLTFDELTDMAANGDLDDVVSGNDSSINGKAEEGGEASSNEVNVPLPDSVGDVFARLFGI